MKALVLSCNTGGGHNAAGHAVAEELFRRNIDCEIKDTLVFGKKNTSRIVSSSYINIAKNTPKLFGRIYAIGSAVSSLKGKSPIYLANTLYAQNLYNYIIKNQITAVICPHLFPAEALTFLRHKYADFAKKVKCYGVCTDYTCIPFWPELDMDAYFTPHEDLRAECIKKGMKNSALVITGIPVSASFSQKIPKALARQKLNIAENKNIFLIMTGSMGFGNISSQVNQLLCNGNAETMVIVLTGTNDKLRQKLNDDFAASGQVLAVPFTNEVALYMDACDVLLTKPGGLSSTEAAVKNIPFVHTPPIPGCETKNANFFAAHGMSVFAENDAETALLATKLMCDENLKQSMVSAQCKHINKHAAADICDYIIAHQA